MVCQWRHAGADQKRNLSLRKMEALLKEHQKRADKAAGEEKFFG